MWQLARIMGSRLTILIGYDMGYGVKYPDSLSEEAKQNILSQPLNGMVKYDLINDNGHNLTTYPEFELLSENDGIIELNQGGRKVYTNWMWITYGRWLISCFNLYKRDVTVINATEGGNLYWTEKGGCNIIPMSLKSVVKGLGKMD
jgi:hypothetical protein